MLSENEYRWQQFGHSHSQRERDYGKVVGLCSPYLPSPRKLREEWKGKERQLFKVAESFVQQQS